MPAFHQIFCMLLVESAALALSVRFMRATHVYALGECDPYPFHGADDEFLGAGNKSALVRVLYAEDEFTTHLLGQEVTVQCCANTTDMLGPCGARSVAKDWFH